MTYCELNKSYKGAELKEWMRETASLYFKSAPNVKTYRNRADFKFSGQDIISWMTFYYNNLLPYHNYRMTIELRNGIIETPVPVAY